MSRPELFTDPASWQARCRADREAGAHIVLVPTMGYLHDGHQSLLREARRLADLPGREGGAEGAGRRGPRHGVAVASIFVNPTQFGPNEDLARYPRDLEGDLARCAAAGIDRVFAPADAAQVFLPAHETWITVERASQGLCGASRPGHFRGVATVVAKLFNLTLPQVAIFGEKDYQQLAVLRAMARDLSFGVELVGMPIVREQDGLALSSRNAYLSPDERGRALALSRALFAAREAAAAGKRDSDRLRAGARETLAAAGARIDYVEIVHPETLAPVGHAASGSVMLVAAFVGKTRLIDNVKLP